MAASGCAQALPLAGKDFLPSIGWCPFAGNCYPPLGSPDLIGGKSRASPEMPATSAPVTSQGPLVQKSGGSVGGPLPHVDRRQVRGVVAQDVGRLSRNGIAAGVVVALRRFRSRLRLWRMRKLCHSSSERGGYRFHIASVLAGLAGICVFCVLCGSTRACRQIPTPVAWLCRRPLSRVDRHQGYGVVAEDVDDFYRDGVAAGARADRDLDGLFTREAVEIDGPVVHPG